LLERVLSKKEGATDFEVEHDFESIGRKTVVLNARILPLFGDEQPMLLLSIDDITDSKEAGATLRESERRYRELLNALPVAVYAVRIER
jgi:PAS domain-containing protein